MGKQERRKKLVVVGDGACGKTSLLQVFSGKPFDERYIPTVFQNFCSDVEVDGKKTELTLWDTAGQEEFERLRPLSYDKVNVLLICFSFDNPTSLENIESKWIPELNQYCAGVPFILVGCKTDLKDDPNIPQKVTSKDAQTVADKIGAKAFMECSAKSNVGIQEIFKQAVVVCTSDKKSPCVVS